MGNEHKYPKERIKIEYPVQMGAGKSTEKLSDEEISESLIIVKLDYAIPDYRDYKNGKYVYSAQNNFRKKKGFKKLSTESSVKAHVKYLLNVGYKKDDKGQNTFVKILS